MLTPEDTRREGGVGMLFLAFPLFAQTVRPNQFDFSVLVSFVGCVANPTRI